MRILHTSDWHIGFVAGGIPLLPAQHQAFSEIAALVEEHQVDVVVISGDVFDKPDPTEAELTVCFEAFAESGKRALSSRSSPETTIRLRGWGLPVFHRT
ncbi:metallophosphoesterase family protein [Nocardia brevicatena]|uniref:metallophosphoesterase family protein n=1 Tax=Nocardia brevicatena TaxID=37327 RepID=UPI0012FA994C|nr:metallophosphoesterase [Nocardia brevicatena]